MGAREVATSTRKSLIDMRYGEGCYENPEQLLVNPQESDPKNFTRIAPKFEFGEEHLEDFTKGELVTLLNDAADRWAAWRVSNMKASILNKGRESAVKMLDKVILKVCAAGDDESISDLIDSVGKAEIIRVCAKYRTMVPKHPLLTK